MGIKSGSPGSQFPEPQWFFCFKIGEVDSNSKAPKTACRTITSRFQSDSQPDLQGFSLTHSKADVILSFKSS